MDKVIIVMDMNDARDPIVSVRMFSDGALRYVAAVYECAEGYSYHEIMKKLNKDGWCDVSFELHGKSETRRIMIVSVIP